jgi:Family of unknown function (DUF5994)
MTLPAALTRMTTESPTPPSIPRLRMEPTGSRRTLLDGGWWPRSTDPVAELPGLVLAIDNVRGPVSRLILAADGWDSHPRRLCVAGRVLKLGYFASQPTSLLTALCGNGKRIDLLIVAPNTARGSADAAMILATTTGNHVHAEHIIPAVNASNLGSRVESAEEVWEAEGGHLDRAVLS